MKLINQFTLWYLGVSTLVLLVGGIIVFYSVQREIIEEEGNRLRDTVKLIAGMLERGTEIDKIAGHQVIIRELDPAAAVIPVRILDTIAWFEPHQHFERELRASASYRIKDKQYFISASNLIPESDEILDGVLESLSWTFALLLLFVGISSRLISNVVLTPFKNTLQAIQSFHIKQQQPISLSATRTYEFKTLNEFLNKMTNKALEDYQSLKEFSENASHELQTPLAIIRGKLELLMNSPITDGQARLLMEAQGAVDKLSKVNQSLTLLTKLENQEFESLHPIDFSQLIKDTLHSFAELIELKCITLEAKIEPNVRIHLNAVLANILLNNLLSNAIRHNHNNGNICVALTLSTLTIRNTGNPPQVPTHQLFERFKKSNKSNDSIGLGLSIVKQICDIHHFTVEYQFTDNLHTVEVNFHTSK